MFANLNNRDENWAEVQQNWKENIWFFTTFFDIKNPLVFKKDLGNMPTAGYVMEANMSAEQWFWKKP